MQRVAQAICGQLPKDAAVGLVRSVDGGGQDELCEPQGRADVADGGDGRGVSDKVVDDARDRVDVSVGADDVEELLDGGEDEAGVIVVLDGLLAGVDVGERGAGRGAGDGGREDVARGEAADGVRGQTRGVERGDDVGEHDAVGEQGGETVDGARVEVAAQRGGGQVEEVGEDLANPD